MATSQRSHSSRVWHRIATRSPGASPSEHSPAAISRAAVSASAPRQRVPVTVAPEAEGGPPRELLYAPAPDLVRAVCGRSDDLSVSASRHERAIVIARPSEIKHGVSWVVSGAFPPVVSVPRSLWGFGSFSPRFSSDDVVHTPAITLSHHRGGRPRRHGRGVPCARREAAREVAVKVLHAHLLAEPESKARLEREARAVAKLNHDGILQIFDYSGEERRVVLHRHRVHRRTNPQAVSRQSQAAGARAGGADRDRAWARRCVTRTRWASSIAT